MAPQPNVNRSMPDCSIIIPVLGYTDVVAAIGYLTKTFGFTERWRTGNHRAQLSFGNGAIAITDATSPIPQHLMVRVADVIAHHDHALEQGASILQPGKNSKYRCTKFRCYFDPFIH
ncbi:MAG: hypothetical protein EOP54_32610 [Sphingobacteriales bacterium]|nr:MAG: hypothetical protein EOP54_32610 [Sphingobacteriales bacterium]